MKQNSTKNKYGIKRIKWLYTATIVMYKYYIIYKDDSQVEGTVNCKSTFLQKVINPSIDEIYTYQIWQEVEEESFDLYDYNW
jgi:hypothetical protein